MNRFALGVVALVAITIAAVVFFAEPEIQPPPPVQPPTVRTVALDAAAPLRAPRPPLPPPPAATSPAEVDADAGPIDAAEQGPYRVDLGEHSILLAERDGRFLRVGVQLVTPTAAGRAELVRRRRELVRMLYFLASKRSAEAVEQPGAEARFEEDLAPRFGNAVRSGAISDIEFTRFEIERRALPVPDAGALP